MEELSKQVTVKYQQGQIELQNAEALKQVVKQLADKYKDLVITEDTIKNDRATKNELNGLYKKLEEQRKAYKRAYKKPLDDFESKIKDIELPLNETLDNLKSQLKDYRERAKQAKADEIEEFIVDICDNYEYAEPTEVPIQSQWLNTSTSKKQWQESVLNAIKLVSEHNKQLNQTINTVKTVAETINVNADPYIRLAKNGSSSDVIIKQMNTDKANYEKREQAKELAKQAEMEKRSAQVNNKTIDKETGEIIENKPEIKAYRVIIKGTDKDIRKLGKFAKEHNIEIRKDDK